MPAHRRDDGSAFLYSEMAYPVERPDEPTTFTDVDSPVNLINIKI